MQSTDIRTKKNNLLSKVIILVFLRNKNIASWLSIGICTTPCTAIATHDTKKTPVHKTFFMGAIIIIIVQWYNSY